MKSFDELITYLAENAGSSIQYRITRDVLKVPIDAHEMKVLQTDILSSAKVKKVFSTQQDSGFLGHEIHGGYFSGLDANVALLKRLGVSIENPRIQRAKNMLLNWSGTNDTFHRSGTTMDEYGRSGDDSGPLSFRYDWLEEPHIARFMFYDTPKTLASLIFDTFEKLNAFEE